MFEIALNSSDTKAKGILKLYFQNFGIPFSAQEDAFVFLGAN